jgi:hypothetical protein
MSDGVSCHHLIDFELLAAAWIGKIDGSRSRPAPGKMFGSWIDVSISRQLL